MRGKENETERKMKVILRLKVRRGHL